MKSSDHRKSRTGIVLLLIFFGLAGGILAGGYFAFQHYEQNYRKEVEAQLSAIAELKVNQLVQYRNERLGDANIFFNNPAFSILVRSLFEIPAHSTSKGPLRQWLTRVHSTFQYDRIILLDANGVIRMSVPEIPVPITALTRKNIDEVLHTGRSVVQDFYRNEYDQKVYLAILVPIFDDSNRGRPLGILILRIDPSAFLYPFIQTWPVPSRTSETLIVRRDGDDVLFLNDLRFSRNAALNLRVSLSQDGIAAVKAVRGARGIVEAVDYRDVPILADVRSVPDSPWFLVARMDREEIFEPVRVQLRLMIIAVFALITAAGAGVGLVWRHQRSRFYREEFKSAEALRETNAYLENLINYANAPIVVWDPSLCIQRFNHAFETLSAYTEEEVKGKPINVLFADDKAETSLDLIRGAVAGDRWETVEIDIQRKDGSSRVVLWNSANILDRDGTTVVATIAQGHDITERKKAEEEIRLNARRLNVLIDILQHHFGSTQEFLDYSLGKAIELTRSKIGYIYHYSEEAKEFVLNSWSREVMKECTIVEKQTVYELEKTGIWGEAVRQRKPIVINDFQSGNALKKGYPEGHAPLLKYLTIPVFSDEKIVAVVGVANKETDYTETDTLQLTLLMDVVWKVVERKRAEHALRESESKFRTMTEQLPVGIVMSKRDGHGETVMFFNKRFTEMTGYTIETVSSFEEWSVRAFPDEGYRRERTQVASEMYDEATKSVVSQPRISRVRCGDGTIKDIEFCYVDLKEFGFWTMLDMTERNKAEAEARRLLDLSEHSRQSLLSILEDQKQAEEAIQKLNAELEQRVSERTAQLEAANKELEAFSYSVSHDLRAPLRAIDGFSRILSEEYSKKLDVEGKRLVDVVCANTKKMDELITDMLDLSRVSRNEMNLSRVDMKALANSIFHETAPPEIRQKFSFSVAPVPDADCDPNLMRQVWRNLISNAVKFTIPSDMRTIEIGGRTEAGMNLYFIRDSGVGFDPRYVHKLFGVFQRLHKAEDFEGTGVGLAIVQRIIHRHGGKVWAEGRVGEGATFWFSIPRREG